MLKQERFQSFLFTSAVVLRMLSRRSPFAKATVVDDYLDHVKALTGLVLRVGARLCTPSNRFGLKQFLRGLPGHGDDIFDDWCRSLIHLPLPGSVTWDVLLPVLGNQSEDLKYWVTERARLKDNPKDSDGRQKSSAKRRSDDEFWRKLNELSEEVATQSQLRTDAQVNQSSNSKGN